MLIEKYIIKNDMSDEQLDQLLTLTQQMWWSKDRTMQEINTMLKHCIPFAVIENNTQRLVAFARVLTDAVKYAYIYDVMAEENLRGRGIGKMIMNAILIHPALSCIKYFELTCAHDMVGYYKKFGFTDNLESVVAMRKKNI